MEVAYTTWGFVGPLINPICSVLMRKETICWIFIEVFLQISILQMRVLFEYKK